MMKINCHNQPVPEPCLTSIVLLIHNKRGGLFYIQVKNDETS